MEEKCSSEQCCDNSTQTSSCDCACSSAPTLLFPCSGGSDVGALSDQAARRVTAEGSAKMYCLAGIGGRISGILASTKSADNIVAIDGCPLNCAKATLEQAGITQFTHFNLHETGTVTDQHILQVAEQIKSRLS